MVVDPPVDVPRDVAFQPADRLCPSTSQNGVPGWALVTRRANDVSLDPVTATTGVRAVPSPDDRTGVPWSVGATDPAAVIGDAPPPGSEASTSRSRSYPTSAPAVVRSVWSPAPRVMGVPQSDTSKPLRASASVLEPVIRTETGCPSSVRRSLRHSPGRAAAAGGTRRPARSTSASPTGIVICCSPIGSRVVTDRMLSTTRRMLLPRTGGKETVTVRPAPGSPILPPGMSVIGGMVSVSTRLPSTTRPSALGTEWRPSATTDRVSVEKLTGFGELTWIQASVCIPKPGLHSVVGSPSNAPALPAARSPGSRPDDSVVTRSDGRPVDVPRTRSLA